MSIPDASPLRTHLHFSMSEKPDRAGHRLIPPPRSLRGGKNVLRRAMGLGDNAPRYRKAMRTVSPFTKKHFDLSRPWSEQEKARLSAFRKDIGLHGDKIFRRYVDLWPAIDWAHQQFRTWRSQRRRNAGQSRPEGALGEDVRHEERIEEVQDSEANTVVGSPMPEELRPGIVECTLPDSQARSLFHAFLRGLEPVLEKHFDKFSAAGINCVADLRDLMEFPRREKERFLKEHCGIRVPLEVYKVCLALGRLQTKVNVIEID